MPAYLYGVVVEGREGVETGGVEPWAGRQADISASLHACS